MAGVDGGTEGSQGKTPQVKHALGRVEFVYKCLDDERKFLATAIE